MPFEKHLFISYAHLDNQPLAEQQQGWVTKFHASLSAMLNMRLGRKAEIWRDSKLAGNDIFADEIIQQFAKTALLISVVTPRYVESEWCTREAQEFCAKAEETGGLLLENKSRVLKVVKIPADQEDPLPDVMKRSLGYPFYVLEGETPLELDSVYGEEFAQQYNRKLAKLAFDIAQLIKQMEKLAVVPTGAAAAKAVPAKMTVYLAECSYDRRDAREALEAQLKLHGYDVLPDAKLPIEEEAYVAEVQSMLRRCQLSVHLVGAKYGVVPDGPSDKSVVILQNELAIARCQEAPLPRLIWVPEGTHAESPQQQQFLEALKTSPEQQKGADLITADIETLKLAMRAALQKIEEASKSDTKSEPQSADNAGRLVYVLCDERDRKATVPLRRFFKQHGIDAQVPVFEGDAATVRQAHQDMLAQCDGLLLFYGSAEEAWKRSVDSDLRKLPAYRGAKPLLAKFTYLAEPGSSDKSDLIELEEPNLINGLGGFSDSLIEPFLRQLGGGGPS